MRFPRGRIIAFAGEHLVAVLLGFNLDLAELAVPILVAIILLSNAKGVFVGAALVSALFASLWYYFYPTWLRSIMRRQAKKLYAEGRNSGTIGKHAITLHAENLTEQSDAGQATFKWETIEKVVKTDDFILIYTSSLQAHVIPRRSFATVESYNAFFNEANTLRLRSAP